MGPDVKLIVCLRDPVQRAIAGYIHHYTKGLIDIRADSIINAPRKLGLVHIGFYADHLRHWFRIFPQENFFITTYEEAFKDTNAYAKKLFEFLGVDPNVRLVSADNVVNRRANYRARSDGVFIVSRGGIEESCVSSSELNRLCRVFRIPNRRLKALCPELDLTSWSS